MNTINLLPRARQQQLVIRRRERAWWIGGSLYAAGVAAVCVVANLARPADAELTLEELERAQARLDATESELRTVAKSTLALRERGALARGIGGTPDWSHLLAIVAQPLGAQLVLDGCELASPSESASTARPAKGQPAQRPAHIVRLSGVGTTATAVTDYVLALESLRLFRSVKLVDTGTRSVGGVERTAFRIECALGDPPQPARAAEGAAP